MGADRFFRRGVTKFKFLPAIAAANLTPTRPEIVAGTDLSPDVADIDGWLLANSRIPTPALDETFDSSIAGIDNADDSSLTMFERLTPGSQAIRTALAKNTVGFMFVASQGDVATRKADVFPCVVTSRGNVYTMGNDPARYRVQFGITAAPALDVTIP
jgi:hypothetical protein